MKAYRCKSKSDDSPLGHIHDLNLDMDKTMCGKVIPMNGTWYFDDRKDVTCPKCRKIIFTTV